MAPASLLLRCACSLSRVPRSPIRWRQSWRSGKPDSIVSTEYDKPRPPMVTKFLVYKKEGVRFVFLADAPIGSPPPYKSWKLIGAQDPKTDAVLKGPEAKKRMAGRKAP